MTRKALERYPSQLSYNNISGNDSLTIGNLFAEFFQKSYDSSAVISDNFNTDHIQSFDYLSNLNFNVNSDDVYNSIAKCDVKYSFGPDGIPSVVLVKCAKCLTLPLVFLFNKSLSMGSFPNLWKSSFIIPLYKNGGRNKIENYRPVARLSCIPKIFESIITDVVVFNARSIICPEQHGFIRGRSTTTNLLDFVTYCLENFKRGNQVDCVYILISVRHSIGYLTEY